MFGLGRIKATLIAAGLAVIGFLAAMGRAKRKSKKEAYDEMQEQDRARADGVRNRVRDVERVQPGDITYRD